MDLRSLHEHVDAPPRPTFAVRPFMLAAAVLIVTASRLLPHPHNVTPVAAVSLFAGACFTDRRVAFLLPISAMVLSDAFIGFSALSPVVYACLLMQVAVGFRLRRRRDASSIAAGTLFGSCLFFLATNAVFWLRAYPGTLAGLAECYASAAPFFGRSLLGDAAYSALLFGALALVEARFPAMRERPQAVPV